MTTLIYDDTLDFSDTQAMTDAGFTQHLFVDWPPSMPSTPLPRRSYSEELEQQPDDDYWNLCRRIHADIRAENNRKAEALGFASWEEKESHDEEENRKWLEDYIREHGHPPPSPVYTEEEEAALKLQYERSLELERAKLGPEPCNCEEHLHPRFCPQKLISYKSQGDDPAEFHYFHSLQPIDLNITIYEGARSNRMPDGWLEHLWGMPTQSGVLRLPQWAKRDEVVQGIINEEEVDEITYHGDRKRSSRNVSLTPEFRAEEHVDNLAELEQTTQQDPQGKREESAVGLESKQKSPSDTSKAHEADANTRASQPAEPIPERSETQSHSKARASTQQTRRNPRRAVSVLGLHETKRFLQAQASGIKKRPRATKRNTKSATPSAKTPTRAQGALKTWTPNPRGCTNTIPRH